MNTLMFILVTLGVGSICIMYYVTATHEYRRCRNVLDDFVRGYDMKINELEDEVERLKEELDNLKEENKVLRENKGRIPREDTDAT